MTFKNSIRKLLIAEGYKLSDYEIEAKTMDGNLVYVVRFCRENGIHLNYDNAKGVLIREWSLLAESIYNDDQAADELIVQILKACDG